MGDYSSRRDELAKKLATFREQASAGGRSDGPPYLPDRYTRAEAGIESYCGWREKVLADALKLLRDSSEGAQDRQRKWSDYFGSASDDSGKQIAELCRDDVQDMSAATVYRFWVETLAEETRFFKALAQMSIARFQGLLQERKADLEKHFKELDEVRSQLLGLDQRQHGEIAYLRLKVLDYVKQVTVDLLAWPRKLEESFSSAVQEWARTTRERSGKASASTFLAPVLARVSTLRPTTDDFVRQAMRLYADEETWHVTFCKTRETAIGFMQQADPEHVEDALDEEMSKTYDWAGRSGTDAQVADARQLVGQVVAQTGPLFSAYRDQFQAFCSRFKGSLIGAVSPEMVDMMIEQAFFERFWADLEASGIARIFQDTPEKIAAALDLSLNPLEKETAEQLRSVLHAEIDPLKEQLRAIDLGFWEGFKTQFYEYPRRRLRDAIESSKGWMS